MRITSLFCLLLLTSPLFTIAQQLTFDSKYFNHESGMPNMGTLSDVKADSEGFIWIISFGAIFKYNGQEFSRYNNGNAGGAPFIRFFESSKGKKFILDSDGSIFFIGTDSLLPYPYNDSLKKLNSHNRFLDVYFDLEDRLHISFSGTGYCVVDQGNIVFPFKEKGIKIAGYSCIFMDNGYPLVSRDFHEGAEHNREQYYYLFDQNLNLVDTISVTKLKYNQHPSVVKKADGHFLFSSGRGNIIEFNKQGFIKEIPYDSRINRLFVDKQSALWVSKGLGTSYYANANIGKDSTIQLNNEELSIVTTQDFEGGIWLHADNTLEYISHPMQKLLTAKGGVIPNEPLHAYKLVEDKIIISSGNTGIVSAVDLNTLRKDSLILNSIYIKKEDQKLLNYITALHYDSSRSKIWMSRRGKIITNQKKKWVELSLAKLPSINQGTKFRFSDKVFGRDYSLVAMYNNRYFIIKNDTISYVSDKFPKAIANVMVVNDSVFVNTLGGIYLHYEDSIYHLGDKYTKLEKRLFDLTYFQKNVWLSTINNQAVYILRKDSLEEVKFDNRSITSPRFRQQNAEKMWIMSFEGSFLVDYKKHKDTTIPKVKPSKAYILLGALRNNDIDSTYLYQGTSNKGIARINFKDLKRDKMSSPRFLFTSLKTDGKSRTISDSIYPLAYNKSFVQISYIGLSYYKSRVIYRHRMLGLQDKWIETEDDYIQFTTLPVGEYTFEIQCKRSHEVWSKSHFLNFKVSPPFWKTWWFIGLSILFFIVVVYQIASYRFSIVQKEKNLLLDRLKAEQKALRAQMSPHFIFNIISSIRFLVNKESREKTNHFLDLFSTSMRNILNQSNENQITIQNEINFLREYIEMERFRLENHFDFKIKAIEDKNYLSKLIPPFIIQPIVENAIQHGLKNRLAGGSLELGFEVNGPYLKVTVRDNGIGREKAKQYKKTVDSQNKTSLGIRIIRERLELHNGKKDNLKIIDLSEESNKTFGTVVCLEIKTLNKLIS